ncbi:hypothetical protein RhiirA5_503824 [Rhizophagus irregularis]|uniref:histidine kinase n=1 Tax=Rhizophagus irregularis TaxID=588596 RepID=A0A2N0P7K9_9GLOM|nr:hypothetical protein RhiirA5_503824 [Rhizophagus irregularis]CAB4483024.1 unnamed protein product [Rhizophagus irregularis]CAB5393363.1 unnamed protein product [Rhizophagus irregularis]
MSVLGKESPYADEAPVADLVHSFDWSTTPLGDRSTWPPSLKTIVDLCLHSVFPIAIFYGPELRMIYNQMYRPILKMKHPQAMGRSFKEVWSETYDVMGPIFEEVNLTGIGSFQDDMMLLLHRDGYAEECYFSFTLSPVFKEDGTITGVFNAVQETTQRVLAVRRLKTLEDLGNRTPGAKSAENACHLVSLALQDNDDDIPFAMIYLLEDDNLQKNIKKVKLIATTYDQTLMTIKGDDEIEELAFVNGISKRILPDFLSEEFTNEFIYDGNIIMDKNNSNNNDISHWHLQEVITRNSHVIVTLKDNSKAILLPVLSSFAGETNTTAIMVCGLNPRKALDRDYMEFLRLAVSHVSTSLTQGRLREGERKHAQLLADLNKQKINFFQNISHELRTPLTLMLSPLEDAIACCPNNSDVLLHLQMVRRNSRRLLKLVNTLLQFSRIEVDSIKAQFHETEIAKLTAELASSFESMAKSFELKYVIDVPKELKLSRRIFIDQNMYEKILFNLCSNAFKHTWTGSVTVRLYSENEDDKEFIVLEVIDTGVGIPNDHIPNLFNRFYRVESRQSRSYEGTGIGLALVKELVNRHGGDISVVSVVDKGSIFKVRLPTGWEHLPPDQVYFDDEYNTKEHVVHGEKLYSNCDLFLEESAQWIQKNNIEDSDYKDMDLDDNLTTEGHTIPSSLEDNPLTFGENFTVLIVDDNTDMRDYIFGVLKKDFDVCCACDGLDALRTLKKLDKPPDLILSDVMMPNMNGYDLLKSLKNNKSTRLIPVILLSAKVGEEASLEGLEHGADDYLIKPFSAKELIARIRVNIKLSCLHRQLFLQQKRHLETKRLLFSISRSGLNIQETLSTAVQEIHHVLPCDRFFIVAVENEDSRIMAFSSTDQSEPNLQGKLVYFPIKENNQTENLNQNSLEVVNETLEVVIFPNYYLLAVQNLVSLIALPIKIDSKTWGWVVANRPPNNTWLDSEKSFLQQMSNQIGLAINHSILLEEKLKKEAQMEAMEAANEAKSQILANTSHELRTPLGAIIGILSAFEDSQLSEDQKDMVQIMTRASDVVLAVVNDILDAAKLEANKVALLNSTFDLFSLMEKTIELFGEKAGAKNIELILCCEPTSLPKFVKSDPERLQQVLMNLLSNSIKFTDKGEVCLKVTMKNDNESSKNTTAKKSTLFVEIIDTGIGIDPRFMKVIWESFSQGDASMTRRQDGTGLGLPICKQLVKINGGEMGVQSELGKGSRFWFTWLVESSLSWSPIPITSISQTPPGLNLPTTIRLKRVVVIDPVETARNALVKLIGSSVERIDSFDSFSEGVSAAKVWRETHNGPLYDIAFFNVNEDNVEEVKKASEELRYTCGKDQLCITLMVYWSASGRAIGQKLIKDIGGPIVTLCKPIMQKRLLDCLHNSKIFRSSSSTPNHHRRNSVKPLADIRVEKYYNDNRHLSSLPVEKELTIIRQSPKDNNEKLSQASSRDKLKRTASFSSEPTKRTALKRMEPSGEDNNQIDKNRASKSLRSRPISKSKRILCVEDNPINLKVIQHQLKKLGYPSLSATNGQEAVHLIQAEYSGESSNLSLSLAKEFPTKISLILMDCAMPIMSGFDASKAIRTMSNIPIIALTASAIPETRERCFESGMNDYLTKPLKIGQLKDKLIQWLGDDN